MPQDERAPGAAQTTADTRRVLMLAPSYSPHAGGVEKHIQRVCAELLGRGHEIRIATPLWEPDWPQAQTLDGIPIRRVSRDGPTGRGQLRDWFQWADIVHSHDAYPFLKYGLHFRFRLPPKRFFVTFHGYEGYPIPLEAKALRRVVLWLTRGSICAGAFIPKWYRFSCTHITHGGVDCPDEMPVDGEGAVFVGRLEKDTGFLDSLEALKTLRNVHGIGLPLTVCGDGSLREQGEAFADRYGIDVTFTGRVPDVTLYLLRARFAFTSGLLGMLEAMANGCAVLATYDNPLKRDYLRLFPGAPYIEMARSPGELAARTALILRDPAALDERLREAFEFARTQTWSAVADLYEALWGCGGR